VTNTPDTDPRTGLAVARRLYLHYQAEGHTAFAEDLARVTTWYERACDEIDRLRTRIPAGD
jgi:hypothetical protein